MAQLTDHFADTELNVAGADPRLIANATYICQQLLEPIRAHFGPVNVHSGYRTPEHNAAVGGKPYSYHLYNDDHSAADIDALPAVSISDLFDWIRLESGLPIDKVIIESNADGIAANVHLQIDSNNTPRRLAFAGDTGAGVVYVNVPVGPPAVDATVTV